MAKDFSSIPPSPVYLLDMIQELQVKGVDVVRFDVAEPRFKPPETVVKEVIKAIKSGYTYYTHPKGLPELREKISSYINRSRRIPYDANSEIIVVPGGKFAVYSFFASVIERNDQVIVLSPSWPTFRSVPLMLGAKVVEVPVRDPYMIDEEKLKEKITPKTKVIVVNTPNNPTGGVMDRENLKLIADLSSDNQIYVLSDEVDWPFVYDGREHVSIASLNDAYQRTLMVDSFSKIFAMTGWRIGFAAGPREIIDAMEKIQQHSTTGPATFIQKACVKVLEEPFPYIEKVVKECREKRNYLLREVSKVKEIKYSKPHGTYYFYPDISNLGLSSEAFTKRLLYEDHVAVTPGTLFGVGGERRIRISYAVPKGELVKGLKRLIHFILEVK